jgi:hypothetical protein
VLKNALKDIIVMKPVVLKMLVQTIVVKHANNVTKIVLLVQKNLSVPPAQKENTCQMVLV